MKLRLFLNQLLCFHNYEPITSEPKWNQKTGYTKIRQGLICKNCGKLKWFKEHGKQKR